MGRQLNNSNTINNLFVQEVYQHYYKVHYLANTVVVTWA